MVRFLPGPFGGDGADLPQDNLDLERFFRLPKSRERHIRGHRHAGVREGPTPIPALDAQRSHPSPFAEEDLLPYRRAAIPECRKIMEKARSKKGRDLLLKDSERRYSERGG